MDSEAQKEKNTGPDLDELRHKIRRKWGVGDKLIAAAWGVEIIAASIGLLIAGLIIFQSHSDLMAEYDGVLPSFAYMNMFLGGLPFMMVAVVELCKIPLATAAYHAGSYFWKTIFFLGLLFLMAITFETVLNGFERNFTQRTYSVNHARQSLQSIEEKITEKRDHVQVLKELTSEDIQAEQKTELEQLRATFFADRDNIDTQLDNIRANVTSESAKALSKRIADLNDQIARTQEARDKARAAQSQSDSDQRSAAQNAYNTEKSRLSNRIQYLEKQIETLNRMEAEALSNLTGFEEFAGKDDEIRADYLQKRQGVQNNLRTESAALNNLKLSDFMAQFAGRQDQGQGTSQFDREINILTKEKRERENELTRITRRSDASLKPKIASLEARRQEIEAQYEEDKQRVRERHQSQMTELGDRETQINTLNDEITELEGNRLEARDEIARISESSQVYRVTAFWFGKDHPADVTKEELRTVSFIWFGSLAAIVAWTGTLLAFGGLVVKYHPDEHRHRSSQNPFLSFATFRRWLVDLRRRAREPKVVYKDREIIKTVEVEKEIPVDKVVVKEVPKEIIRKEIVYVPFYTDDPDLLETAQRPIYEAASAPKAEKARKASRFGDVANNIKEKAKSTMKKKASPSEDQKDDPAEDASDAQSESGNDDASKDSTPPPIPDEPSSKEKEE